MSAKITWDGDKFQELVNKAINAGLTNAAESLNRQISNTIGVDHGGIPSKPYNPPHVQSGQLKASWNVLPATAGVAYAGSSLNYSVHLEKGTWKMLPRPYVIPSINNGRADMMQKFVNAASRVLKKGGTVTGEVVQ